MSLSDFLRSWAWAVAGDPCTDCIAVRFAMQRESVRYRWHQFLLRLPLIGRLTRAAITARAARTLALLAGAAVPLLDALAIAAQNVQPADARTLAARGIQGARRQRFCACARREQAFPPIALRLIASGERSGCLAFEEAAAQQQRELDRALGLLSATLGPAVILLVGAMRCSSCWPS